MSNKELHLFSFSRYLSIILSISIFSNFITPEIWILKEPASVIGKVAQLSLSPLALSICWTLSAGLVIPFIIMQIFIPGYKGRREVIKLANYGMIGGACLWVFLSFLSRNLGYGFATWIFLFNGFISIATAAIMANDLNNDQTKENKELKLKKGDGF